MSTGAEPVIPAVLPQTRSDAQALMDKLSNANPISQSDTDTIDDAIDSLNVILTQLNQEEMLSKDGAMQAAAAQVKDPLKKLSDLKNQLNEIASRVKTLAGIADDVNKVVGGCTTVFGLG